MTALPSTPELRRLARRLIWFEKPGDALRDRMRLAAYALTYGTHADVKLLRRYMPIRQLHQLLKRPPPGIFDARSWAYWHLKLTGKPAPALPRRRLTGIR
jgi:hypothetical protein